MCQLNERKGVALSRKCLFLCAQSSWSLDPHLCGKFNELTRLFLAWCLGSMENGPARQSAGSCPAETRVWKMSVLLCLSTTSSWRVSIVPCQSTGRPGLSFVPQEKSPTHRQTFF